MNPETIKWLEHYEKKYRQKASDLMVRYMKKHFYRDRTLSMKYQSLSDDLFQIITYLKGGESK